VEQTPRWGRKGGKEEGAGGPGKVARLKGLGPEFSPSREPRMKHSRRKGLLKKGKVLQKGTPAKKESISVKGKKGQNLRKGGGKRKKRWPGMW